MVSHKTKPSNQIPDWVYRQAEERGISYSAVYQRWRNEVKNTGNDPSDWEAILQAPLTHRRRKYSKRGRSHGFRLPIEYEDQFKKALIKTGKTKQDFVADLVIKQLDELALAE